MTEPKRWIDGGGPGRALVASLQGESLTEGAKLRMRASLGIAAGAGIATVAGTAAAAKGAGAAATTGAKGLGAMLVAKWIGIVAVSGAAAVGAGVLVQDRLATEPLAPAAVPAAVVPAAPAPRAAAPIVPVETPVVTPPSEDVAPVAPVAPTHAAARATSSVAPRSAKADLTEELRLLELARRPLRAGDPAGALAALRQYRSAAPRGALGVEADALEVEALVASGRRDEANAKGRSFLAHHGEGPLADRVRRLVGSER